MGGSELHTPATGTGHNGKLRSTGAITGMVGGVDEFSYSRNSIVQSRSIELLLKPVLQQEIGQLKLLNQGEGRLRLINVADLGCGVGANTLRCAKVVLDSVRDEHGLSPDIQYFLTDLPTNDVNTLFQQLEGWKTTVTADVGKFYPAAVAGSFFQRCFPPGSLHVVISTWALHYLSQVPDAVTDKASAAYTKHRAFIHKGPPAMVEAYAQLSKQNLRQFFSARAEEVASGGLVVLYFPARVDDEHPRNQFQPHLEMKAPFGTLFEETWRTLAMEGTISEELWNSFNVPCYGASVSEVRAAINSTDAFHIKHMKVEELYYLDEEEEKQLMRDPEAYARFCTKFVEPVMRSYIQNHIGQEGAEKFFQRLTQLTVDAVREKHTTRLALPCMLVVLIRK